MEETRWNNVLYTILVIVFLLLVTKSCVDSSRIKRLETEKQIAHSEVSTYRNKLGEESTKVSILQTENKRNFLRYQYASEDVRRLQKLIKDTKGITGASVLGNSTAINSKGATVITKTDTVIVNDTILVYPTYTYSDSTRWYNVRVSLDKDTAKVRLLAYNEFEITQTDSEITVKNLNPNTDTEYFQTVKINKKKGRVKAFLKGAATGAIITLTLIALL